MAYIINPLVHGKSVQELMNLDKSTLNNLTPKELRQVTSRLVSAVNKRIRRLEKYAETKGIEIPSLQALKQKHKGKQFSIKGVEDKDILTTYSDIKEFMNYKTSNIRGLIKVKKDIATSISNLTSSDYNKWTEEEQNELWDIYAKVVEPNTAIFYEIVEGKKSPQRKSTDGVILERIIQLQKTGLSKTEIISSVTELTQKIYGTEMTDEEVNEYLAKNFSIVRNKL